MYLLISGCNNTNRELQEIHRVLATRATAINSRNISRYISVISLQYSDKGKDYYNLKESLEKNFRDFEQISYEATEPSITVNGSSAEVSGGYRMKFIVRGREMNLNGNERLRLKKESDGWKIIAGI